MFYYQLKNELWKLFGKKRTYIGFGAFVLAQMRPCSCSVSISRTGSASWSACWTATVIWRANIISALTVALVMLFPQILLLMPLVRRAGGRRPGGQGSRGRHAADDFVAADFTGPAAAGEMAGRHHFFSGAGAGAGCHCTGFCAPAVSVERHVCFCARNPTFGIFPPGEGLRVIVFSHLFMVDERRRACCRWPPCFRVST